MDKCVRNVCAVNSGTLRRSQGQRREAEPFGGAFLAIYLLAYDNARPRPLPYTMAVKRPHMVR